MVKTHDEIRLARRARIAATIGTGIEWYDFYIYGLASTLVFGELFFPDSDPLAGTMLALSSFLLGFVIRPVGALVFGHFGDRLGRKSTLIATLLLMGIGTSLVGVLPTHATVGGWAPVLLVLLRVVQGFGVGGEWGGAVLMSTEWRAGSRRRGLHGSWPQLGSALGMLLATGVLSLTQLSMSDTAFASWGWRIPFLVSIVLVGVGFAIRIGVVESAEFRRVRADNRVDALPALTALRGYWRQILATAFMRAGQTGPFYVFTTFVVTYGTQQLGFDKQFLTTVVLIGAAVELLSTPTWGWVSDRVGRRRLHLIGALAMAAVAVPYFGLLNTGATWAAVVATVLALVVHDMMYAPQASLMAEAFPAEVRYTGTSLAYHLGSVLWAGPAALIATALYSSSGSWPAIAGYVVALAAISFLATLAVHETPTRTHHRVDRMAPGRELSPATD